MTERHALSCERRIRLDPGAVLDGFIAMYGDDRPAWVLDSALDLRVGGEWTVRFRPEGLDAFTEHRVITVLDRPHHLRYRALTGPGGTFDTTVDVRCAEEGGETLLTLRQSGFPTEAARDEFASAWPEVLAELDRRLTS